MTRARSNARLLYVVLLVLTIAALMGLAGLYVFIFEQDDRMRLAAEIGKGLIQIFTIAVIGSVVKLLVDDHQRRLREANEARVRAQQREQLLQEFRMDKVRRLVGVTNILRRTPVLIDAHRSAKTYNEQMREVVDASLELRLIRHETDAIGPDPNPAFPAWPEIRGNIRKMEEYLAWVVKDFRGRSKELSELQREAESDRSLQPTVWEHIASISSVRDLLHEVDAPDQTTRYAREYLQAYESAMRQMIISSLDVPRSSHADGGAL